MAATPGGTRRLLFKRSIPGWSTRNDRATPWPRPATGSWSAYPFPSSIILYQPGQGYVRFDQAKAEAYLRGVMEKMTGLVEDTIAKWDKMGL